jgi:hypothetical protein
VIVAQFDVHRTTRRRMDGPPFLVVVPSSRFKDVPRRLAIPLVEQTLIGPLDSRLSPTFTIDGVVVVLATLEVASLPLGAFGDLVGNLSSRGDDIIRALGTEGTHRPRRIAPVRRPWSRPPRLEPARPNQLGERRNRRRRPAAARQSTARAAGEAGRPGVVLQAASSAPSAEDSPSAGTGSPPTGSSGASSLGISAGGGR